MKKLADIDYQILRELIRNSKITDRKIAKLLGVSQPTITRRRDQLEKEQLIAYTGVPNLKKLGFEILAFHFLLWKREEYQTLVQKTTFNQRIQTFIASHPCFVFVSSGQGMGMSRVGITIHKTYSDFTQFREAVETEWGTNLAQYKNFLVSIKSDRILRNLTYHFFADCVKPQE